jgi:hypothetical protein
MPYIGRSTDGFGVRNRFIYLATSGATSVSGADANGATLTFTDGAYVDVYLNGVLLKPTTDYNTSTANTIAGLSALNTNDEVTVVVYDVFTVGDMVSATSGGTFSGAVTLSGGVSSSLTVANGLTLTDGDVTVASGHGINFAATSDASGMASELLDDYEEGTYTIAMTAASSGTITLNSSFNTGHYTKIGDTVTVHGHPKISSVSSPNGNTLISLPFTAKNDNMTQGVSAMLEAGVTYQTNQTGGFMVLTSLNTSTMTVLYNTDGDFFGLQAQNGGLGANDQFRFSITYKVEE